MPACGTNCSTARSSTALRMFVASPAGGAIITTDCAHTAASATSRQRRKPSECQIGSVTHEIGPIIADSRDSHPISESTPSYSLSWLATRRRAYAVALACPAPWNCCNLTPLRLNVQVWMIFCAEMSGRRDVSPCRRLTSAIWLPLGAVHDKWRSQISGS